MKLHVPSLLRRAIMACYATAAFVAPALGSAALAAGAALYLFGSGQVLAVDYTAQAGRPITFTSASGNGVLNGSGTLITADDTITFGTETAATTGYFTLESDDGTNTTTFNAKLIVNGQGLTINDGSSNSRNLITNSVSGSGNITRTASTGANNVTYIFSGDMADYTGSFTLTGGTIDLTFRNSTATSRSLKSSSIRASRTLTFDGDYTLGVAGTLGAATVAVNGALTVNADTTLSGNLRMEQAGSISGTGKLILGTGTKLSFTDDDLLQRYENGKDFTLEVGQNLYVGDAATQLSSAHLATMLDADLAAGSSYGAGVITVNAATTWSDAALTWTNDAFSTRIAAFDSTTEATLSGEVAEHIVVVDDTARLTLRKAAAGGSLNCAHILLQGTLTLADDGVLDTASRILFDGGTLSYAPGTTTSTSGNMLKRAEGYAGPAIVHLAGTDSEDAMGMWDFSSGVSKAIIEDNFSITGKGTLTLNAPGEIQQGITIDIVDATATAKITGNIPSVSSILHGKGTLELAATTTTLNSKANTDDFLGTLLASSGTARLKNQNDLFDGTITLAGSSNALEFYSDAATGGGATTLRLESGTFRMKTNDSTLANSGTFQAGTVVIGAATDPGTVVLAGRDGAAYTFVGSISGSGTLAVSEQTSLIFTGDLSTFAGTLRNNLAGKAVTFAFGDGSAHAGGSSLFTAGAQLAALANSTAAPTYVFNYSDATLDMNAALTGNAQLTHAGTGTLVLTQASSSTGTLTIGQAGATVQLGDAEHAAAWAGGSLAGSGSFVAAHGTLAMITDKASTVKLIVESLRSTGTADNVVDLGGTDGSLIDSVILHANSYLTGVTGTLTFSPDSPLVIAPTSHNSDSVATPDDTKHGHYMINGTGSDNGPDIVFSKGSLDIRGALADFFLNARPAAGEESVTRYIYMTDGGTLSHDGSLATWNDDLLTESSARQHGHNIDIVGATNGALMLTINSDRVYMVTKSTDTNATLGDYGTALGDAYNIVSVASKQQFTLNLNGAPGTGTPKGMVLNRLDGGEGAALVVTNTLTGAAGSGGTGSGTALVTLANEEYSDGKNGDSLFNGDIVSEGAVKYVKTGSDKLEIGGSFTGTELEMQAGTLELSGEGNAFDTITMNGTATLAVSGDTGTGVIVEAQAGGTISIAEGKELSTSGASSLNGTSFGGGGTLKLLQGAELTLAGSGDQFKGIVLEFEQVGATLKLTGGGTQTVSGLSGAGTIVGGTLAITGNDGTIFSGELSDTQLAINEGASQSFAYFDGSGSSLTNAGSAEFSLKKGLAGSKLTLDSLTLGGGSTTTFLCDVKSGMNNSFETLTLGSLTVEDGAIVTIAGNGEVFSKAGFVLLGSVENAATSSLADSFTVNLQGSSFARAINPLLTLQGGQLYLNFDISNINEFLKMTDNPVSAAGAEILWNTDTASLPDDSELAALWNSINDYMADDDTAAANAALAAVAGASTATLGHAFAGDMERQLRAIRNRTTTMGVSPDVWNADLPYFNAWINGEGDYRKVEADGYLPGYELTSWGGTVGFDVDCSNSVTAGLAFTAMYGDLETESADKAKGDMDTYYLSAFARATSGRWVHTFVGSIGRMSATLDRTVDYGMGGYRTQGRTNGLGFGLMYEVGYTVPLDEDASACLQPVANVTWRHVSVDAYDEEGSHAGLAVGEQEYDALTFGVGARLQAVVGESIYNRTSILELRALLKLDAGDRGGEAEVAMLYGGSQSAKVNTAELGAVGAEVGLGLTIPIDAESSSIFIDLSADFRSGATNANAAAGYRVNF